MCIRDRPGISGIEVLEEIQREDPQSRIVMCSAVGQEQMIQQAVMLGAKDFIVKPFRPDEFRRIVRNAIAVSYTHLDVYKRQV